MKTMYSYVEPYNVFMYYDYVDRSILGVDNQSYG